jgi:hypothetical protein
MTQRSSLVECVATSVALKVGSVDIIGRDLWLEDTKEETGREKVSR